MKFLRWIPAKINVNQVQLNLLVNNVIETGREIFGLKIGIFQIYALHTKYRIFIGYEPSWTNLVSANTPIYFPPIIIVWSIYVITCGRARGVRRFPRCFQLGCTSPGSLENSAISDNIELLWPKTLTPRPPKKNAAESVEAVAYCEIILQYL